MFWSRRRDRGKSSPQSFSTTEAIPNHESLVRRALSDSHGQQYVALRSLEEARSTPDGVVVLEGDWGGQIYVVCPVTSVRCDATTLEVLLREVDAIAWPDNQAGARVFFERHPIGAGIWGGMGGATVTAEPWVHSGLEVWGLGASIRAVLAGTQRGLSDVH